MKQSLLVLALAATFAVPALGQMAGERGTASVALDKGKVSVEYGRPSLKGRDPLALVKPGMEWRLGSNAPTTLTTEVPLKFGDLVVPAGTYVLKARMNDQKQWALLFDRQGASAERVGEAPLELTTEKESAEQLTITVDKAGAGGRLLVQWGTLALAAPFQPA